MVQEYGRINLEQALILINFFDYNQVDYGTLIFFLWRLFINEFRARKVLKMVKDISLEQKAILENCRDNCLDLWRLVISIASFQDHLERLFAYEEHFYTQIIDKLATKNQLLLDEILFLSIPDIESDPIEYSYTLERYSITDDKSHIFKNKSQYRRFRAIYQYAQNIKSARK